MGYKSREAWSQTTFNKHELQIELDKNDFRNIGELNQETLIPLQPYYIWL